MPLIKSTHDASFANFAHLTDKSLERAVVTETREINERAADPRAQMSDSDQMGFARLLSRYLETRSTASGALNWEKIEPPSSDLLKPYTALPEPANDDETRHLLRRVAVLRLNGGLGTSMGCSGPKSVIEVRSGQTFLDIIVKQIEP